MLSTKIIKTAQEIDQFSSLYFKESRGHKPVDSTYLRQCHLVRVFYRADTPNEWLGGYVINTNAPYRYFVVLDEDLKNKLLLEHGITEDDISEVTCICIKSRQMSQIERMQIYFTSMVDAFAAGKSYIFGGSTEPKIVALQQQIMPHDFHSGTTYVGDEFTDYWIYYTGRIESVFTMLRFILSELARPFSKPKRKTAQPVTSKSADELVA